MAKAVRVYYDGENQFPVAWPNRLPGAWMTLSLRPNPHDLLSGRLDDQLHAIIPSAPAHSELAFWHENIPGNPLDYPSYVNNPATARRMQRYGQWLCRGTKVRFGVIICGPAVQMPEWIAPAAVWAGGRSEGRMPSGADVSAGGDAPPGGQSRLDFRRGHVPVGQHPDFPGNYRHPDALSRQPVHPLGR